MIGEIRDFETAQIAIQASLTGHLVLATLHTNDAPSAVTRLTDMGVEPFLLQLEPARRAGAAPGAQALPALQARRRARPLPPGRLRRTAARTGYKGRTGVYELMAADDKVRALIHSRAAESQICRRRRGRRPALDARGRRAPGRRRHHLARRSDARHARMTPLRRCALDADCPRDARLPSSKPSTPPASPRTGLLEADNATRRARAAARAGAGAAGGHAGRRSRHRGRQAARASRGASSAPPAWRCGRASSPGWSAPACRSSAR